MENNSSGNEEQNSSGVGAESPRPAPVPLEALKLPEAKNATQEK